MLYATSIFFRALIKNVLKLLSIFSLSYIVIIISRNQRLYFLIAAAKISATTFGLFLNSPHPSGHKYILFLFFTNAILNTESIIFSSFSFIKSVSYGCFSCLLAAKIRSFCLKELMSICQSS